MALSTKYTATFGNAGGYTTCTYNGTTITNINYFTSAGTYTVNCTAYGNNGKSSGSKSMTVTLVAKNLPVIGTTKPLPCRPSMAAYVTCSNILSGQEMSNHIGT